MSVCGELQFVTSGQLWGAWGGVGGGGGGNCGQIQVRTTGNDLKVVLYAA